MTVPDDHVKQCASVGHFYINATVVRCPHRESYSLFVQGWTDSADDDTDVFLRTTFDFGPFDPIDEIERTTVTAVREALAQLILRPA